jgi:serine/threonine protein kinase
MHLLTQEIVIGRTLDHESVCKLHFVYEDDTIVFLVMESIEGATLVEMLASD